MAKPKSQTVRESREKAGLVSRSVYVAPADWDAFKAAAKASGMSQGAYLMHLLALAQAGDNGARAELQVNAAVAAELRRLAKDLEDRRG